MRVGHGVDGQVSVGIVLELDSGAVVVVLLAVAAGIKEEKLT